MATDLQKAAARRKVIYLGGIILLYFVTLFWRGKLDAPFGNPNRPNEEAPSAVHRVADTVASASIFEQSKRLDLRELDQGDPDLAGSAAQYSLLGFRGPVVTLLWRAAIEKQKRNEFEELDLLVRIITELQPNFITPWIFQSWNIAYNVSVENDKLGDMYYYIARGIELLAKGDRRNTKPDRYATTPDKKIGSPDIRYQIGFYYQNKFGVSDKVNTLRSIAQVSCIPPVERNPDQFLDPATKAVDLEVFRKFCEKNPQLVRRLRTKLNCSRPEDVVNFLRDNADVPSRFSGPTELAVPELQFPALPPRFPEQPNEYFAGDSVDRINDTFDYFLAGRAWFSYAVSVVPPPKREWGAQGPETGEPIPWAAPRIGEYDEFRYRVPRSPALIIFRQQPPRAQTYLADRMTKEGWFDETTTWNPDERASSRWFPIESATTREVQLRAGSGSRQQWAEAARMWRAHGEANGVILSEERRRRLLAKAGYSSEREIMGAQPQDLSPQQMKEFGIDPIQHEAQRALTYYAQNRQMTNYDYFLRSAEAEQQPKTVEARKLLWEANEAREASEYILASRLYVPALAQWRDVLATNKEFHRPQGSDKTEEDTYEQEIYLIQLLREDRATRRRTQDVLRAATVFAPWLSVDPKEPGDPINTLLNRDASRFMTQDYLQAVAENEAGLRIATALVANVYSKASFGETTPEAQSVAKVGAVGTLTAALAGGAMQAVAASPERDLMVRAVIQSQFPWMGEFRSPPTRPDHPGVIDEDAYWVRPYVRDAVKNRMNLIRTPPASTAPPQVSPIQP